MTPTRFSLIAITLLSPVLGFSITCYRRHHHMNIIELNDASSLRPPTSISPLFLSRSKLTTRARFISNFLIGSFVVFPLRSKIANAFEGGVGGLGKTSPKTGVLFRDPEVAAETSQSASGDVSYELIAPDGTPVFLSFNAPWPLSKSTTGIETRDNTGGYESSFVLVAALPKGTTALDKVKPSFISEAIFSSAGKFGMYGTPTDVRIKKLDGDAGLMTIYEASFTTLTPAMRDSDRKAFISASIVGDGLFLLVTTTTAVRFKKLDVMRKVAESFSAVPAPASNLNQRR